MSKKLSVSPARKEGLDEIAACAADYPHEQARYDPLVKASAQWQVLFREHLGRMLAKPESVFLVARVGGELAGFILASRNDEPWFEQGRRGGISELYVRPEFHRQGVGSAVVKAAIEQLSEGGAAVVAMSVLLDNEAGVSFWKAQGFQPRMLRMARGI